MKREIAPEGTMPEVRRYYDDSLANIEKELESANGIGIVRELPTRPREGKLYYLKESYNENKVGLYIELEGMMQRLLTEADLVEPEPE